MGINLTGILAIYGSAVATTTALWNILHLIQERRGVIIDGGMGVTLTTPRKTVLIINVTNKGKRPINILSIEFHKDRRSKRHPEKFESYFFRPDNWPIRLEEGESAEAIIEKWDWFRLGGPHRYNFIVDSLGKRWRFSRRLCRKLAHEASLEKTK